MFVLIAADGDEEFSENLLLEKNSFEIGDFIGSYGPKECVAEFEEDGEKRRGIEILFVCHWLAQLLYWRDFISSGGDTR